MATEHTERHLVTLDIKRLLPRATTADLLDIAGHVLTALRERNHEMVPAEGRLNGDLADISWLEMEGVWGVVYHTSAGAELTARDYGRLPTGYDCRGCGRSSDGCSWLQNKDAGPGDCCARCDHTTTKPAEPRPGRIRDEDIARVRERASITDVVSETVALTYASGGKLKGLCPFHKEKTPSFAVASDQNIYYCSGCGEGGDVIKFVMDVHHLGFVESVEWLAARTGVRIHRAE